MTPEPSDWLIRSCGMLGNMRRKNGSLANGLLIRTRCLLCTLTTAGSTFCSIGASDGTGVPATALGSAAAAGSVAAMAGTSARASRQGCCRAVAAKPPNAAAATRAKTSGAGRILNMILCKG